MIYKYMYLMSFTAVLAGCSTLPSQTPAGQAPSAPAPAAQPAKPARHTEAMFQVLMALGIDYRGGGASPATGFDCSGLVAHVFREAYGMRVPRNTRAQSETGIPVSLTELQPGDLVFYDTLARPFSHVGIYLGDGKFVHAPKSGSKVRIEHLSSAYWSKRFSGARRIEPPS